MLPISFYLTLSSKIWVINLNPSSEMGVLRGSPVLRQHRRRRVIAKIQVCPHEFSTLNLIYFLDASWKLIALFMVLPVVISVIGVIAYVLINRYFPRIFIGLADDSVK